MKTVYSQVAVGAAAIAAIVLGASPGMAATAAGTIGLSLNVIASCAVNGGAQGSNSLGQVGSIVFPDQNASFGTVDGSLVSSGGVNGISVLCSPGLAPILTIGAGAHDSGALRHLAAGAQQLPYRLFSDAARSNEIAIGQQIPLGTTSSTAIVQPVYARVNGGGTVLPGGLYADTVQVTLSW